jgi:pyrroloquinoline quinone biosynthesis protein E
MLEPCRTCDRREIDWGGCRCQAMAIAGNAAATDPACVLSPLHGRMAALIDEAIATTRPSGARGVEGLIWRRIGGAPAPQGQGAKPSAAVPAE